MKKLFFWMRITRGAFENRLGPDQLVAASLVFLIAGLVWTISACQSAEGRQDKLIVAVAANVQYAMDEIEKAFEAQSGIEVETIIGSSGKLTAQIQQGAPYDLLVSADMKYPKSLFEKGFATTTPEVYAYGTLVLWTMKDLALDSLPNLLREDRIGKIALANPKVAPYGDLAVQWLSYHQLLPAVESRLIYGESIAQTSQYILSGACDLGFTARSVVLSPNMKDRGRWVSLKPDLKIEQGVVITQKGLLKQRASQAFYHFLFGETAQSILSSYGYDVPASKSVNE